MKRGLLSHLLARMFVSLKPPRIICLYSIRCISHSNCIHMEACKVCSVFNSVVDLDSSDAWTVLLQPLQLKNCNFHAWSFLRVGSGAGFEYGITWNFGFGPGISISRTKTLTYVQYLRTTITVLFSLPIKIFTYLVFTYLNIKYILKVYLKYFNQFFSGAVND